MCGNKAEEATPAVKIEDTLHAADGLAEVGKEQLGAGEVDLEEGVCGDEEIEAGEAFGEFPGRRLAKANIIMPVIVNK